MRVHSVSPTLIIGLGGTGAKVVRELKKDLTGIPIVKYIVIDADYEEKKDFNDDEFIHIGIRNSVNNVISDLPGLKSEIKESVRNILSLSNLKGEVFKSSDTLDKGAKQVRLLGRLCLMYNIRRIYTKIENMLKEITKPERLRETKDLGYDATDDYAWIFLVSSLGGGCGSGIFLDVAYLIRYILWINNYNFKINGIFVFPSAFRESTVAKKNVQANTYAALMELNHYMTNPDYSLRYDDIKIDENNVGKKKPFDYVYLTSGILSKGVLRLDIYELTKIIAETILTLIGIKFTGDIQGQYANYINKCLHETYDENKETSIRSYAGIGYTCTYVRFNKIEDYFTFELSKDLLMYIIREPDDERIKDEGQYIISSYLCKEKLNNIITKRTILKPEEIGEDIADIQNWKNRVRNELLPQRIKEIEKYSEKYINEIEEKIENEVNRLTNENPRLAKRFIEYIRNEIDGFNKMFKKEKDENDKKLENLRGSEKALREEYEEILNKKLVLPRTKRIKREELISNILDQFNREIESYRLHTIIEFYNKVLDLLNKKEKMVDNIITTIENLISKFKNLSSNAKISINEIGASYEKIIKISDDWLYSQYKEYSKNLDQKVNSLLYQIDKLTDWAKRHDMFDVAFNKISDFSRKLVRGGSKSLIDFLGDKLRDELNDLKERIRVLWNLKEGFDIEDQHKVSILIIEKGKKEYVRRELPSGVSVSDIIEVNDPTKLSLLVLEYCAPLAALNELEICEEMYDAIKDDIELHICGFGSSKFRKIERI